MLVHRLRRWPNIKPALFECIVFDGNSAVVGMVDFAYVVRKNMFESMWRCEYLLHCEVLFIIRTGIIMTATTDVYVTLPLIIF